MSSLTKALNIQPTGVEKMFDMAGDDVILRSRRTIFNPLRSQLRHFTKDVDGKNKYDNSGLPALRKNC